jgi:hypothetical protein
LDIDQLAGVARQVKFMVGPLVRVASLPKQGIDPILVLVENQDILDIAGEWGCSPFLAGGSGIGQGLRSPRLATARAFPYT